PFAFSLDVRPEHGGQVRAVGHLSQAALIDLYAGCAAAVQPSLYEGFGLGALEAMSVGAPTVVAETPALLELSADAALTFAPRDPAQLAQHLERV
ncbi:glycosyltransferase, partial [Klebsiella pneumoniae]|uniref:glycosyltransferase n=1 Tax=Klebsiella pneumoniae TaxID=573 RepID=UPI003013CB24